jgi:CRP-like cAMP-binding protein
VSDDYYQHLAKMPLFSQLDEHELERLAKLTTELNIASGRTLMTQGRAAQEALIIMEGTAEVLRDGKHIANLGPGDFAGEMALLASRTRNSTVRATSDMTILHIDGRAFKGLLEEVPEVAVKLLSVVATRVVENNVDDHTS